MEEPVEEPVVEHVEEPVVEHVEEPVVEHVSSIEDVDPASFMESTLECLEEPTSSIEPIPKLVFIVPYRDRQQQQEFFAKQMKFVLEDMSPDDYKIYYIHQCDTREFNRGALKNIGFLVVKSKYPNDYQNITLVLNDVDTMPYTKNFLNYETKKGNVKHFYGFVYTLGGIVSINAGDFEKINGFPNLWAWGYEDNLLQYRVEQHPEMQIDRSQFYKYMDKNIFQLKDDLYRTINRTEFELYKHLTPEGIRHISNIQYTIDEETGFVNVTNFNTGREENIATKSTYDLRKGSRPFKDVTDSKPRMFGNMMVRPRIRNTAMTLNSFQQQPPPTFANTMIQPQQPATMNMQPTRPTNTNRMRFNLQL